MYAGEALYLNSQGNAKSSLQALLKAREQIPTNQLPSGNSQDLHTLLNSGIEYINQVPLSESSQNFMSEASQVYSGSHQAQNNLLENSDNKIDFNYSQKLFHIADGNLYSIFSPIQGRSYGMKPSFLRKQKYTVQGSRGHKNLRKGLKFHNFLPSESITSEKDSGYLKKWKVHSECRLQEEHGTKQITISNWSQSIQNAPSEHADTSSNSKVLNDGSYSDNSLFPLNKQNKFPIENIPCSSQHFNANNDSENSKVKHLDINSNLEIHSDDKSSSVPLCDRTITKNLHDALTEVKERSENSVSKKSILDSVLSSLRESSFASKNVSCDEIETNLKSELDNQKHRRKPVCTRRIVPYVKYLSLIEENETAPLDLSSKCVLENLAGPSCSSRDYAANAETSRKHNKKSTKGRLLNYMENTQSSKANTNCDKDVYSFDPGSSSFRDSIIAASEASNSPFCDSINPPMTLLYPLPADKSLARHGLRPPFESSEKLNLPFEIKGQINPSHEVASSSTLKSQLDNIHYTFQKPFIKESRAKARRRSQRSVIKQKLEDTFKQNGFLVKTKQVSDGEATFCKFRQLRKYTRYYLKSWQQHLPDEVHKMWKGFLPPKTVIAPVPNAPEKNQDH